MLGEIVQDKLDILLVSETKRILVFHLGLTEIVQEVYYAIC